MPNPITNESPPLPSTWPTLLPKLRALRAVHAVLEFGSTIAASQAIHISQPAITRAIASLEESCATPLFIRTSRGMLPTPEGEQLAARASTLFQLLKTGAQEVIAHNKVTQERANVAARFAESVSPSQLMALLCLAEHGSESKAATQLGITQPAVHASLQALEQQLATRLFYKLPTGSRLMPPAEHLLLRAKQAIAELRNIDSDIAAWHGQTRGRIVIGILPLSVPIFLPKTIHTLFQQHPNIEVRIIDGTYETLLQRLIAADIDVMAGALRAEFPIAEVQQHFFFEDDLVIIARHDHPCHQIPKLQLADLQQWPWVVPLPNTPAEQSLHRLFAHHQLPPPSQQLCANSPLMTQAFVLQSSCLAITSKGQALLDALGGRVKVVPVPLPDSQRRIGLVTRASTTASPELAAFLTACQTTVQTLEMASDQKR